MDGNFTLFQNASGGGGGSSDFTKDAFSDISNPANSNTGFSSTISTNPLSLFLANDDAPRYSAKTLFIKDLVLMPDKNWLDGKPTYQIIWHEPFSPAQGYFVGNIRLKNTVNGKSVDVNGIDDFIGVTGVIRKIAWLVNPSEQITANADLITDGVDTTVDINFSSSATSSLGHGINHFIAFAHESALETYNIHDFRLRANQYKTMNVVGVIVYTENATADIDQFPGTTYVDKNKEVTVNGQNTPLPVIVSRLGAISTLTKTTNNTYSTVTVENPYINSIGLGASGSNLLDVSTGEGGSFPTGSGIALVLGSSFYVGTVQSQSTDTLTVSPNLPFGASGLVYKTWQSGPTFAISASLYELKHSIDIPLSNVFIDNNGFGVLPQGDYYYSHPNFKYRVWGDSMQMQSIEGYAGIGFAGATGFIQVDGNFSAAEVELVGAGILHASVAVNGLSAYSMNEGFTGIQKKTIFTEAGPGWNSFKFAPGASFANVSIAKINLYERATPIGVTSGALANLFTTNDYTPRFSNTTNASLMPLGNLQRVYADSLFLQGGWDRGTTHTQAGGVFYTGATTNSVLKFQYYGTDFAVIGANGTSGAMFLDGASIAVTFNEMKPVATLGFHSVEFQHKTGSAIVSAFDFLKPKQTELVNVQNFQAVPELNNIPAFFSQSDTPRNPKDGDFWLSDSTPRALWVYAFGKWNKVEISDTTDDPNDLVMVKTHGASTAAYADVNGITEKYNFVSVLTGETDTVSLDGGPNGATKLKGNLYVVDGVDAAGNSLATNRKYNKLSWASDTQRSATRSKSANVEFLNKLVSFKGALLPATFYDTIDVYDGISWSNSIASVGTALFNCGAFKVGSIASCAGGHSGGGEANEHSTWDGSSTGSASNVPVAMNAAACTEVNGNNGFVGGIATSTNSYVWNGSSWSSNIAMTYVVQATAGDLNGGPSVSGYNPQNLKAYIAGGNTTSTTAVNTIASFNGSSWTTEAATLANVTTGGTGAIV